VTRVMAGLRRARAQGLAFVFMGTGSLLVLAALLTEPLELLLDILSVACVGWECARILTVDYARIVRPRPRWLTAIPGAVKYDRVVAEGVPFRRTLLFSFPFLAVAVVMVWWYRDLLMAGFAAILGVQIVLAHLMYCGPRTGRPV
jgi:hypothetical protein